MICKNIIFIFISNYYSKPTRIGAAWSIKLKSLHGERDLFLAVECYKLNRCDIFIDIVISKNIYKLITEKLTA